MEPITSTAPTAPSTGFGAAGSAGGTSSTPQNPGSVLDRDAFLKLLVAQLKYQDPTDPTDASQMMAQTSQLTMVERLDDINTALAESAATDRLTLAGTMVGRQIAFQVDDGTTTGVVDAVRFVNGEFVLSSGGYAVPMDAILEVGPPPIAPVAPPVVAPPAGSAGTPTGSDALIASW